MTDKKAGRSGKPKRIPSSLVIVLAVLALFGGIMVAKGWIDGASTPAATVADAAAPSAPEPAKTAGSTITSVHNDAVADYQAALKTGKPVYVLFHSLTCQPCVEISAVVDRVMPAYDGKVVFVNAISDDPSSQRLASQFRFEYIPTSFFITPDGHVADSFTGSMQEAEMKARLDKLIAR